MALRGIKRSELTLVYYPASAKKYPAATSSALLAVSPENRKASDVIWFPHDFYEVSTSWQMVKCVKFMNVIWRNGGRKGRLYKSRVN